MNATATATETINPLDAKVWKPCGSCGGDGLYHAPTGYTDNLGRPYCFDCNGTGGRWTTKRREDRNAKARARYAAKRAAKAAAKAAEVEARQAAARAAHATWAAEHADVVAGLAAIEGDFGDELRWTLKTWGSLTDRQCETVLARAAEAAAKSPVVEGRGQVTGKIISTKWVDNGYGGAEKMLVADDRGFKVWGTVPVALDDEVGDEALAGHRVEFTGTLKRSGDDEAFGFFSRPTKSHLLG